MRHLLRLYPRSWRARYAEEMASLLDERPLVARERIDLVRGALDAWLHPPLPSLVPIVAALVGGGLWTVMGAAILAQPVPLDWPGYPFEVIPLAIVGVACLLVAALGCALRAGERRSTWRAFAVALLVLGHVAWIATLGGTVAGLVGGPPLAAAQTVAMGGAIAVGVVLARDGLDPIALLLLVAPMALVVPSTAAWPAFGPAWTAIGLLLWLDRQSRIGAAPTVA